MPEQADPWADRVALRGEVETEHATVAADDGEQSRAEPQQARLAGPVRALHEHDLAGIDPQRRACQGRKAPDHGDRVVEHDGGIARSGRFGVHADSTRYGSAGLPSRSAPTPVAFLCVTEQLAGQLFTRITKTSKSNLVFIDNGKMCSI